MEICHLYKGSVILPDLGVHGGPILRFGIKILARAEILFKIFAPPVAPSQLSYDEYTNCTLSEGRGDGEEED